MNQTRRLVGSLTGVAALLLALLGLAAPAQAKPRPATPSTATVVGTLADGTGAVTGTFDVERFAMDDGTLTAVGTFTGSVANDAGEILASGTEQVALPVDVAASDGSCQILDLVLGPLDLDLLGLEVNLDQVHLNITAQSGPGKLLGNLLCGVAGLLDSPAAGNGVGAVLTRIGALLNRLLGVLG